MIFPKNLILFAKKIFIFLCLHLIFSCSYSSIDLIRQQDYSKVRPDMSSLVSFKLNPLQVCESRGQYTECTIKINQLLALTVFFSQFFSEVHTNIISSVSKFTASAIWLTT